MFVEGDEKALFRCGVLYIGSAIPLEASKGLEAIQQPLRERYPYKDDKEISGVEAVLSVMPTGLQMQYLKDSSSVMWFPISTLTFCAAVRCIQLLTRAGQRVPRFVSLNSPAAGGVYSQKPVIFAAITRRTKGRKFLECHSFICKSTRDAVNLVQFSKLADRSFRNGIVPSNLQSLSRMSSLSLRPQSESELQLVNDQKSPQSDASPEFYESPPTHGYFYGTGSTLARSYTVEKMSNDVIRVPRTLDRPVSRRLHSSIMVPAHSHYIPAPRRVVPVPANLSQSSRRFLSPPTPQVLVRKDPYLFTTQSTLPTYAKLPHPLAHSMSEKVGRSPSLGRSQRSVGGNSIRPEDNALRKSRKDAAIKNGRDTESSSGSSRPPSPPLDYEPFVSTPGGSRTHLSRKDRYEKGSFITSGAASPPSVIYPYDPYIYPARFADDPAIRPRSLSPPAAEIEHSTKNTRKKKDKSKKKSKKSAKKGSKDTETLNDTVEYSSEVLNGSDKQNRFMLLDRPHAYQNEKAFARSIAAEGRKHGIYDQENTSYQHYPESDLLN